MSQKLYQAAPEPKQVFLVPTVDHNNTASVAGSDYLQWVRCFVEQTEIHSKRVSLLKS